MLFFQTIFYQLKIEFDYLPFTSSYCNFLNKWWGIFCSTGANEHHKLFLSSTHYEWITNGLGFLMIWRVQLFSTYFANESVLRLLLIWHILLYPIVCIWSVNFIIRNLHFTRSSYLDIDSIIDKPAIVYRCDIWKAKVHTRKSLSFIYIKYILY